MSDLRTVIVDNGTGFIKAGFAGDTFPHTSFPNLVGRPMMRSEAVLSGLSTDDVVVGADTLGDVRAQLDFTHPIEHGRIVHWEDMERVWDHCFDQQLHITPSESQVLLTEAPRNPLPDRQRILERIFEKYDFAAAQVYVQAVLALYASGRFDGCVVDSGDGVTHVVPVAHGIVFNHHVKRIDLAGRDITRFFIQLLQQQGYVFNKSADFELVREMKEQVCYVADDLELEKRLETETTALMKEYTLPDGRTVKVGRERFLAAEALFQPHLVGLECAGIDQQLFDAINESPMDLRSVLYENVYVSGGTSLFPGFPTRLERSLKTIYKRVIRRGRDEGGRVKIRVHDPPNRKHSVFNGAAILGSVAQHNPDFWITKEEWMEIGPSIAERCGSFAL